MEIKYVIEYEHLKDVLVNDDKTRYDFSRVVESANKYKLELSDEDFKRFFELRIKDVDIEWIMHNMTAYGSNLTDVLISYITY